MRSALFRPGDRPLVHLGLFGLTVCTTFSAFLVQWADQSTGMWPAARASVMFSFTLVLILGTHEMGHYIYARLHGVDTSLPYFIPLPLIGAGTLGAVIRIRGRIPSKNALIDIGAAGPLAGLAVALPLLFVGYTHSHVVSSPIVPHHFPGDLSLWTLGREALHALSLRMSGAHEPIGQGVGHPLTFFGDNLFTLAIQRMTLGSIPPGKDVIAHPMVIAGWFGLMVTMLNLIPIGQLDGGHVAYALLGDKARVLGKVMAIGLALLCLFWSATWVLWLILSTKVVGFRHPEVTDPTEPITGVRKWIAALCLVAFICCVMPVPISQVMVP